MDDDGETAYETLMFLCFNCKIHILFVFIDERDKESTTPCVW